MRLKILWLLAYAGLNLLLCPGLSAETSNRGGDTVKVFKYCKSNTFYDSAGVTEPPVQSFQFPSKRLNCVYSSDTLLIFSDTIKNDKIELKIAVRKISAQNLKAEVKKGKLYSGRDAELTDEYIDNNFPHGARELNKITLRVNGKEIKIPQSVYNSFLEPQLLTPEGKCFTSVYKSLNSDHFFIFISGGDGAGTYQNLYVTDRKKFLSRFIWSYGVDEWQPDAKYKDSFSGKNAACRFYQINVSGEVNK